MSEGGLELGPLGVGGDRQRHPRRRIGGRVGAAGRVRETGGWSRPRVPPGARTTPPPDTRSTGWRCTRPSRSQGRRRSARPVRPPTPPTRVAMAKPLMRSAHARSISAGSPSRRAGEVVEAARRLQVVGVGPVGRPRPGVTEPRGAHGQQPRPLAPEGGGVDAEAAGPAGPVVLHDDVAPVEDRRRAPSGHRRGRPAGCVLEWLTKAK